MPGAVQLDRVVEPGREDRRRPAVVLGGPHHDDRVGRPRSSRSPWAQTRYVA